MPLGPRAQAMNPFPESLLFQRLVAAERDADALLAARRAEAAACLGPAPTATKKLRVYLFSTHSNQPAAASAAAGGAPAPSIGAAATAAGAGGATAPSAGARSLPASSRAHASASDCLACLP